MSRGVVWSLSVLALIRSAFNVYLGNMRYSGESINTVLFWVVPVVYSFALILAMRSILISNQPPGGNPL